MRVPVCRGRGWRSPINITYVDVHLSIDNKVLLIFPETDSNQVRLIPISLLYIAQPLIEAGIEVDILDQRFEPDFYNVLREKLHSGLICVGITCITGPQINHLIQIASFIKSVSNAPIVVGGSHATIFPEQTLHSDSVDYVVIGKGEIPFLHLALSLKNKNFSGMPMVGHKDGNSIVITKGDIPDSDIDQIPYHLISKYKKASTVSLLTSRGCLYNCSFCAVKILYPKYIELPLNQVFKMLKDVLRLQPDTINILDDNFFYNIKRVTDLFSLCRKNGLYFNWVCSGRVDEVLKIDDSVLSELKASRLVGIFLGVESGSERILNLINKKTDKNMVLEVNQKLKRHGIFPHFSFMAGFPSETDYDRGETFRLIHRLKNENSRAMIWKINQYTPYPGTDLFQLSVENGFVAPATLEGWGKIHFYTEDYDVPYNRKL